MKVGIIGSGMVGQQLGFGFMKSGHEVMIGTRDPEKLAEWKKQAGEKGSVGSFADAAKFGEIIALATLWDNDAAKNAINLAGKQNFKGKTVIDITNPLLFEKKNEAPKPAVGYPDSAGAIVQTWLPESRVVKALNTVTAYYMANPKLEEGTATMFIAGNDSAAKNDVTKILANWGWEVVDTGGIEQSYLLEALAFLWIRYGFANNYWKHAFRLMKK
jgi:predicted dinucleotide-binding enzyme